MQNVNPRLARIVSWIAGIVATIAGIALPAMYFALSYRETTADLETEAEINGHIASEVINANPEMWRFQQTKLEEFLSRRPRHGHPETRRLFDNDNKMIAESADALGAPVITRSADLRDAGLIVGRIEISRSLRPLLVGTGEVTLLGLMLGWAAFVALNVLPLRALNRALEDNARLLGEAQDNLKRIRALQEIDRAITSTLDLDAVLNILLQKIDLVLLYAATTVRLFNKQSGLLEPVACRNLDEREWKAEKWRGGRGTPNVAFESKAPVMVRNVQTDPRVKDPEFFRKNGLVSYLGVPLVVQGEVLGVISFYTKAEHAFSDEEVEFLTTLAGQAAIAIHNSQLYEEMIKLAANLSRSNKVKDEFLSVMSHELRTPLNVVMGYTGMIKDRLLGEINPEQEKALEKVLSRARDQLSMISGILQATQMESEAVKVERHAVSLGDFLDDLKTGYAIPLGKELSLVWDYPSDLPVIHTDDEKLKQVLQNLINNAIKFTEKGEVRVSARAIQGNRQQAIGNREDSPEAQDLTNASCLAPNTSGCWVQFRVADTGIGIAKEDQAMIFERFRQVDSSETRKYGGVGIGLYIVKKFTELLGGKIEVESEPGKGSRFTVTLPCEN